PSSATMTITNSALTGNTAGSGGAVTVDTGTVNVTNSTFAGNGATSGGAFASNGGTTNVLNTTISGNSASATGGIISRAASNMANSIVFGNGGGDCSGGINHTAPNLGCGGSVGGDPLLGGLTDSPAYFPLQTGSPAIDSGSNASCPATDQRGAPRPVD